MTTAQLRFYVLEHRDDQEAFYAFIDKVHEENPNPTWYSREDLWRLTELLPELRKKSTDNQD